jgi:hypothetical protein
MHQMLNSSNRGCLYIPTTRMKYTWNENLFIIERKLNDIMPSKKIQHINIFMLGAFEVDQI